LNLTLQQNSTLQKARADLEASRGLVIQTRAIALPTIAATGNATRSDPFLIEQFPFVSITSNSATGNLQTNKTVSARDNWSTEIRITQTIYQGGRTISALHAARLTREQALLQYQTAVADTLLATRVAYYDVLVAQQQIVVNEASTNL